LIRALVIKGIQLVHELSELEAIMHEQASLYRNIAPDDTGPGSALGAGGEWILPGTPGQPGL